MQTSSSLALLVSLIVALAALSPAITSVHAHGAIVGAKGLNNIQGKAIGVLDNTPRTGTRANPFQRDSSIIRDRDIRSGRSGPCGRTIAGGNNNIQRGMAAIKQQMGGLPMIAPGQPLTLTVHQVNADGAGPYTCELSQSASGRDFQRIQVTQNLPGRRGLNGRTNKTPQPLTVMIPQNAQCTGGADGNACIVRCRNPAAAGPFGGCVPVMMERNNGNGNNDNGNDNANNNGNANGNNNNAGDANNDAGAAQ
ncbi:hypothetical protein H9P43_002596 [Blastocladiella emersonii ATCC 22665]|nr:hypothetical protein H9P43_002590 [Blastocladiella emersonii ATCC 22665]KAI9188205.1 hypothetical protein H9P43_002596 [Blastocladiella emersonii ATCC 22665]